ncbi:MAG TPA: isochorismatase family protein [Pyrinomonadaceae bacterium]|nr:isochorismatase family protein [Pyrinomonadaceae bacterium]
MPHPKVLDISKTGLLVVDVQEAFRAVIDDSAVIAHRIAKVVRGFQLLHRPVIVTEQYPKGLGRTAEEIRSVLPSDFEYVEKSTFSACGVSGFQDRLRKAGISQVVLCGLETHVCVNQTAHDLLNLGFDVHLLADCVASRTDENKRAGLAKMFASGVVRSSVEMALFEMMSDSKHHAFKEIQSLIK